MKKTALILVFTMLISVFSGYGVFSIETQAEKPANGPQSEPFAVSATETTELSQLRFTKSNIYIADADNPWYNANAYATLEGNLYLSYDLDVEKAGSYRLIAKTATSGNAGRGMEVLRPGKVSVTTDSSFSDSCDVILAKASLKTTTAYNDYYENDLGVVYLEEGENKLSFRNSRETGKSFYVWGFEIIPVEEDAPLVFSVRDAKELKASAETDLAIYSNLPGVPYVTPYIGFNGGNYLVYDVVIPSGGIYSFTTYGGGAQTYTLSDVTNEENPVTLINASAAPTNGNINVASPYEHGKINLAAGTYTFKLSASGSNHFSYFTLSKVSDLLEEKQIFLPAAETVKVDYAQYNATTGGSGLDFGYNSGYRDYVVYAEEAGVYDFVLNYSSWNDLPRVSVAVDGDTYISSVAIENREGYGNYTDVNLGSISLKQGVNTIKLTPGSTINMPHFTLKPSYVKEQAAQSCENVETDALETMSYNGAAAVKLAEGNKLDFTVNIEEEKNYNIYINASVTTGYRKMSLKSDEDVLIETEVCGTEHGAYKTIKLGTIALAAGENKLSLSLDEGVYVMVNTIMVAFEEVELPEIIVKGPQTKPFPVSATETTSLSPLYYTKASVSGAATWYDTQSYATLDMASYTHHYVGYDLDVEKAGAYRVKASIGAPAAGSIAQIVRKGKNVTDANDVANNAGDVILSKAALLKTASSVTPAENDFGVIWLDEGITRLSIANDRDAGKAFYYFGLTLTPVEETAPIVVSVRDAKKMDDAGGTQKTVLGFTTSVSAIAPFVQFFAGEYHLYDVYIPEDGIYSFTTFGGGEQTYTLEDVTNEEASVTLVDSVVVPSNGNSNIASPYEAGRISLAKGTHTFKLSAGQANHFSYFTLRKISDTLEENVQYLGDGEKISVDYRKFTAYDISAGLDFGYGGWREYTIFAEKDGAYDFILNYGATEAGLFVELNGAEVFADLLPTTETMSQYAEERLETIRLKKGKNVIKLSPEGTLNMKGFKLAPVNSVDLLMSNASNIEADVLFTLSYDGGTTVRLSEGEKLVLAADVPKSGEYVISINASVNMGSRTISVTEGEDTLLTTEIKGQEHGEYSVIRLGKVYLEAGEHTLSLSLDAGYYAYFESLNLDMIGAKLFRGNTEVSATRAGTLTAKVDLQGEYVGEEFMVVMAVYKTDARGRRKLAYADVENFTVTEKDVCEVSVEGVTLDSSCTYQTKVFVLDNLSGLCYEF